MQNIQNNEQHWKLLVSLLKEIASSKGIKDSKIAELTGYSPSTIGRIFRLDFCPKLSIFLDIMRVLEVNIFFESKDSETDLSIAFNKAMDKLGRNPDTTSQN
ncbi:helix-turn-helix domain-containing protein [Tenacibaculum singaporense]|uniref:helix-turn-helix domain-containing protein n=1 Tax=Tenacibaculum singaporense TaxID=2358479 RepID=UPI000F678090|nr:helix-turn-helix transcriptional regulator [Tenacibaculum singaporense]RSC96038.1 XRE family transcriptional regulator [Tenacibaculum singaporense]